MSVIVVLCSVVRILSVLEDMSMKHTVFGEQYPSSCLKDQCCKWKVWEYGVVRMSEGITTTVNDHDFLVNIGHSKMVWLLCQ